MRGELGKGVEQVQGLLLSPSTSRGSNAGASPPSSILWAPSPSVSVKCYRILHHSLSSLFS